MSPFGLHLFDFKTYIYIINFLLFWDDIIKNLKPCVW